MATETPTATTPLTCSRCGNPAVALAGGGASHPLRDGTLLYPCYGDFGGVLVAWPGTSAELPRGDVDPLVATHWSGADTRAELEGRK